MSSENLKNETKIKPTNLLNKIRSKYILKQIFANLHKKSFLKISQYNKHLQKTYNISFKDYKKYSEIEIEIIPKGYGRFINIPDNEEDKSYFHIYYDKNKEEENEISGYLSQEENVKKIKLIIDYEFKSFNKLFSYCGYIKSINFKHFERNNRA